MTGIYPGGVVGRKTCSFEGRRHFFFAASRAVRDIMVENARRKAGPKCGGDLLRIEFEEAEIALQTPPEDLLDLERALDKLERESPDRARVVLLSYFGGLTHPEIADVTGHRAHRRLRRHGGGLRGSPGPPPAHRRPGFRGAAQAADASASPRAGALPDEVRAAQLEGERPGLPSGGCQPIRP